MLGIIRLFFSSATLVALTALICSPVKGESVRFYNEISPPYYFLDANNQAQGINVELANAIIRHTHLSTSIEHLPWARAVYDTIHTPNIVLMSILKTPEREAQFRWLGRVHNVSAAMFTKSDRQDLTGLNLDKSKSIRVGTIRGYGAAQFLLERGFKEDENLVLVSTPEQLWSMLAMGRLDAVLSNKVSAQYELQKMGLDASSVIAAFDVKALNLTLHMATGLSTPLETVEALKTGLETIQKNGEFSRIMEKWQLNE